MVEHLKAFYSSKKRKKDNIKKMKIVFLHSKMLFLLHAEVRSSNTLYGYFYMELHIKRIFLI